MLLGRIARKLRLTLLPPATKSEAQLIGELRRSISQLSNLSPDNDGAHAGSIWTRNRLALRDRILRDDPRRFLNWEVIRNTMFVGNASYISEEYASLRRSEKWESHWRGAIRESGVGLPLKFPACPDSNGNIIHHAYHLSRFEQRTGQSIERFETIVEFGGGYGSACLLARRLGFKGRYFIFDLPEFSALQRFYLKMNGLGVADAIHDGTVKDSIFCLSNLDELTSGLKTHEIDLFIANWSLSETPLQLRTQFSPLVSHARNFLISYQDTFGEVDNRQFFADWATGQVGVSWTKIPIKHLPSNNYLIGTRTPATQ